MVSSRTTQPLRGLIAAVFTPMHADGSVNILAIERQAEHLVSDGVVGAFVCGTTGEGASLSVEERLQVAARWAQIAKKELAIIVHTGHASITEAKVLASHAQAIGAHATAAIAPYFHKPADAADLVSACREIASAAPDLPFYYYHIPAMTGVPCAATEFLELAVDRIKNLAGVKFTSEDLFDFARAREMAGGHLDLLFGRDEMLLAALPYGTRGFVGSTYNYAAFIYQRVIAAFDAAKMDDARDHQATANQWIAILHKYGGLVASKAIMGLAGVDCGPTRLPLHPLPRERLEQMRQELEESGFFQTR